LLVKLIFIYEVKNLQNYTNKKNKTVAFLLRGQLFIERNTKLNSVLISLLNFLKNVCFNVAKRMGSIPLIIIHVREKQKQYETTERYVCKCKIGKVFTYLPRN